MPNASCRYCKAEMPEGARYCAKCQHHQRRWDQFWSQLKIQDLMGVMSVGALAVTSVVGGSLNANAFNPHSDIKASLMACRDDRVEFAVSNIGNRPAFIRTGAAALRVRGAADDVPNRRLTAENPLSLDPGKTAAVVFLIYPRLPPYATPDDRLNCKLGLAFSWVEPGAHDRVISSVCGCPEVPE